ncbi:MAG: FixH family protein [Endozoicomonas sp.]|uniref:FixH family protein n=1 Tax=Endozoicomonas sp. TaxID=1892382 RepID=UPI003D9B0CCD
MRFVIKCCILFIVLSHVLVASGDIIKSDNGAWAISFASALDEIELHKITDVEFNLLTADARPATGLKLKVEGGMPGHGHGFPTSPYIEEKEPGLYALRGISFSMRGAWLLVIKVESDNNTSDQFTLPLYIKP